MFRANSQQSGTPGAPTDAELVRLARQGNLEALTQLYEHCLPLVYNRVRYVIPEQDVEDVTQEIFLSLMKSLKSFKGEAQFTTWLRTLTNRRVADYYRRRNPLDIQAGVDLSEGEGLLADSEDGLNLDDRIELRRALQSVPDQYREIILLRFAEGLQFGEIARLNEQSLEAAKSLFRRAIEALRRQMSEDHA